MLRLDHSKHLFRASVYHHSEAQHGDRLCEIVGQTLKVVHLWHVERWDLEEHEH